MTSEPLVPTPATRAIPAAPTQGPRRAPSITRVFTAAFLAIAVGVLADRYVTWQSARRTQADMVELTHRLERLERLHPSLGLETQLEELRELAADVGDNAIQSALQTTVILAIVLVALAIGLWYNRRRLVGDAANVLQYTGAAAAPVRAQLQLPESAAPDDRGGLALVPLRSRDRLVGLLVVLLADDLPGDAQTVLEQAAPNLAIACERESAHQHTRRLAVEVRRAAQRLESQNAMLEEQHQELTRLNAELDQAGKLRYQFLANVSHELRTPLNSVIGFSDLLLTMASPDSPLTDTQRDYLETIARNGRHLLDFINELLDLSKIAAGHMQLTLEPLALD